MIYLYIIRQIMNPSVSGHKKAPLRRGCDIGQRTYLPISNAMGALGDDAVLSAKEDLSVQERKELDVFK